MVLAFDFCQPKKNRNIISFIITELFLNEQNGILEIAAMGESEELKRPKRLPSNPLEPCGLWDTSIPGVIYNMRKGKNEVNSLRFASIFIIPVEQSLLRTVSM